MSILVNKNTRVICQGFTGILFGNTTHWMKGGYRILTSSEYIFNTCLVVQNRFGRRQDSYVGESTESSGV